MLRLGLSCLAFGFRVVLFQFTRVPHLPPQEAGPANCQLCCATKFKGSTIQQQMHLKISQVHVDVFFPSTCVTSFQLPATENNVLNVFSIHCNVIQDKYYVVITIVLTLIRQRAAGLHSCLTPWSRQPRNSWHITLNKKNVKQTQRNQGDARETVLDTLVLDSLRLDSLPLS